MSRFDPSHLRFVADFVDRVTIRPLYADLLRMKRDAAIFRPLPRVEFEDPRGRDVSAA